MKKFLIASLLSVLSFAALSQVYNPALSTTSNKPYGMAQAGPTDARSYFYDEDNFKYRPYTDTGEVKSYLSLAKYRTGQFDIIVNTGGTLAAGVITGGTNAVWYFKDGTDDDDLVLKGSSAEMEYFGLEDDAAAADRMFTWGAFGFAHTFDNLAGESGWTMTSSSTAAASNLQRVLDVQLTGANANAAQRTSAIYAYNGHSGSSANNHAITAEIANTTSSVAYAIRALGGTAGAISAEAATTIQNQPVVLISQTSTTTGNGLNISLPTSTANSTSVALNSTASNSLGLAGAFTNNYQSAADSVITVLQVSRTTSSSIAAAGLGARVEFKLTPTSSVALRSNALVSRWTSAVAGSRSSAFDIYGYGSGTERIISTFNGNGSITEPSYGDGSFTSGTLTYLSGWDANGNRMEVDPNSIGGGGGGAWGSITGTLSDQTDLQTALDTKVDENSPITGDTKTKITYDSKGLVTAGADAGIADITGLQDSLDAKFTGTPTWQQTIDKNRTNSGLLIFDTAMAMPATVETPALKTWLRFHPLVSDYDSINAPFYFNQGAFRNNGKPNEVMTFGWNVDAGGGQATPDIPGIGEAWESNYQIDASGYGARLVEKHDIYLRPNGSQVRLGSYTINSNSDAISLYHSVGVFDLRSHQTELPYYAVQGTTDLTETKYYNTADNAEYVSVNADFNEIDGVQSAFRITAPIGLDSRVFGVENFTSAELPGQTTMDRPGIQQTVLSFKGNDISMATIIADSLKMMFNSQLGRLDFAAENTLISQWDNTDINFYRNVTVGPQTSAIARLDVQNSAENVTAYFDNTKTSGTKTAVTATTVNAGTSNRGIDVAVSGATENIGIRITTPSVDNNNYAIKSDATAKSYFGGPLNVNGVDRNGTAAINLPQSSTIVNNGISWGDISLYRSGAFTFNMDDAALNGWGFGVNTGSSLGLHLAADVGTKIFPATTGWTAQRNTNDANTLFTFNQNHASATGDIIAGQFGGGTVFRFNKDGKLGIGTAPSAYIHALGTTEQLRLSYDASNYSSWTVNSGGDLTVAPSGGDLNVTGSASVTQDIYAINSAASSTIADSALQIDRSTGKVESRKIPASMFEQRAMAALGSSVLANTVGVSQMNITGTLTMVDGTDNYVGVWVPEGFTSTGVKWWQGAQGNYTADNTNSIALFSYSAGTLTKIAETANNGDLFKGTPNSIQTTAWSTPVALSGNTLYFVAFLWNATGAVTTAPTIGHAALGASGQALGDFTNSAKMYCSHNAQTAQPATTRLMSALTQATSKIWAGLY